MHSATLYCGISYRDDWGGYRTYAYSGPESSHLDPRNPVNLRRWLRTPTTGDRSRFVRDLQSLLPLDSFRLVDTHGHAIGARYTIQGAVEWRPHDLLVFDRHGEESFLPGRTRVRVVDQQPEDRHSLFSRMLKAAHKKG